MGSLDILGAKNKFLQLVDSLNSSHLPGFTIWLDAKLAEYKVIGTIQADSQEAQAQQYPEWISRSLRQNLSFIFQGDKEASSAPPKPVPKLIAKRCFSGSNSGEVHTKVRRTGGFEHQVLADSDIPGFVIKEEVSSDNEDALELSQVSITSAPETFAVESSRVAERPIPAETPLPTVQESFSLRPPHDANFSDQTHLSRPSISASFSSPIFPQPQPYVSPMKPDFPVHEFSDQLRSQHVESAKKVEHSDSPVLTGRAKAEEQTASSTNSQGPSTGRGVRSFPDVGHQPCFKGTSRVCKAVAKPATTFVCAECHLSTNSKNDLNVHMRIHTGVKPYSCPHCSAKFNRVGNCYNHQRHVHKNLPVRKVLPG